MKVTAAGRGCANSEASSYSTFTWNMQHYGKSNDSTTRLWRNNHIWNRRSKTNERPNNIWLRIMGKGCQMVPNLANITINHCFTKNLPNLICSICLCQIFGFFLIPIVTIDETGDVGLVIKWIPKL